MGQVGWVASKRDISPGRRSVTMSSKRAENSFEFSNADKVIFPSAIN
ncbi:Uncharacterised protein [Bartonella quintana]|uniref:Uncharacterized protein n=1 Tax=Bartonella quintana JK 73 TaxID=1402976 RepID=W3TXV8_BARQI|nr:hypothetical protein Q650_01224 [Bartonella quintana JK 73rel]ETS16270.1 hypothetical protein Q649_01233 [Bartonella quintana JK 73]SQF96265.1 Uncharacterised protein [Bartonella quintana]